MPLPPLPDNVTPLLYVDYSYQDRSHTLQMRFSNASFLSDAKTAAISFLNTLVTILDNTWAIAGARWRDAGSIVTLPTPIPGLGATPSGGTVNATLKPRELGFTGRGGTSGRIGGFFVYGSTAPLPGDFRYQPGEVVALDDALENLALSSGDVWLSKGFDPLQFKPYVNSQNNSYWETRARG